MRTVLAIGIGAGDPDQVTVEAIRALNRTDVFFLMDKGPAAADLLAVRRTICERYIDDPSYRVVEVPDPPRDLSERSYAGDVGAWHDKRVAIYETLLLNQLADGEVGAFLVWGDPALYDSTLRLLDAVADRGAVDVAVEVIPGISAIQALAAAHRIALHGIGRPVHVTTGRRLSEEGWPDSVDDVVVMLDGRLAFNTVEPEGVDIFWGAYLGTPDQLLISGPLARVAPEIERVRSEARERKGWMFDTYLLRRNG